MAIITVEIEVNDTAKEITETEREDWFCNEQIIIDEDYLTRDPSDTSFFLFTPINIRDN